MYVPNRRVLKYLKKKTDRSAMKNTVVDKSSNICKDFNNSIFNNSILQ